MHLAPQSTSVVHAITGYLVQVPVVEVAGFVGIKQVTNPGLPQVDRAAQRVTLHLQFVGTRPCWESRSRRAPRSSRSGRDSSPSRT